MKKYFWIFTSVALLQSCGGNSTNDNPTEHSLIGAKHQTFTSPELYNDYIVRLQDTITKGFMSLSQSMAVGDSLDINKDYQILSQKIDHSKDELSKLDGFEGNTELREEAKKLFEFYDSVLAVEYKDMIEIVKRGETVSERDSKQLQEISQNLSNKEMEVDHRFQQTQMRFAKDFNLQLQEHPLQETLDTLRTDLNRK